MENQSRGLGLDGEWRGVKNWYGGQIQQLGRLTGEGGNYKIILEPMEKRRSHRFARRYGSRRFLQLRIPEQTLQNENAQVKRYFTRRFVLCGRLFAPFHSKEGSLYLVETNQNHGRSTEKWCGDQYRMSFQAFINWHNPLVEFKNYNQVRNFSMSALSWHAPTVNFPYRRSASMLLDSLSAYQTLYLLWSLRLSISYSLTI